VTGMLCMLGNKPWRREGEQIVGSEAHVGEWSRRAQLRKMCRAELYCGVCNLERWPWGPPSGRRRCTKDKVIATYERQLETPRGGGGCSRDPAYRKVVWWLVLQVG
jgi:hypothetical protein